jgi:hypothetical protein
MIAGLLASLIVSLMIVLIVALFLLAVIVHALWTREEEEVFPGYEQDYGVNLIRKFRDCGNHQCDWEDCNRTDTDPISGDMWLCPRHFKEYLDS